MKRYHPILVALHWGLAGLIIGALVMGGQVLAKMPNSDPAKMLSLKMHMTVGLVILVLMLVRLLVRIKTQKPARADIGNAVMNKAAIGAHHLLYLVVIVMSISGIGISIAAGLPDIVFGGSGAPLPTDFDDLAPRTVHSWLALVLKLLIVSHVFAAFYHQFVRKDSLFSRMWFGKNL
ncbi:MAG TPA: cytochrome B [Rhodobacteraceae bacterium]|nr:cytochrome B [Paracoccaceae bacterium]